MFFFFNSWLPKKWKTDPEDQMTAFPGSAGLRSALLNHRDDRSTTPNHKLLIADQTTDTKTHIQKLLQSWHKDKHLRKLNWSHEREELWQTTAEMKAGVDHLRVSSMKPFMEPALCRRSEGNWEWNLKHSQSPLHKESIRRGKKTGNERTKPEGRWAERLPSCLFFLQIPLKAKLERSPKVHVSKKSRTFYLLRGKKKNPVIPTQLCLLLEDIGRFMFVSVWKKKI